MHRTVETPSGSVRGCRLGRNLAFRGIPYAAPPVGALRFAPPAPVDPWVGVRDALDYGASPMQELIGGPIDGSEPLPTSEDCLYLNVFTADVTGERPVMVLLHGGGFVFGSGAVPMPERATLLQRDDVVVVTLNYRVGVLGGFLNLGDVVGDSLRYTPNVGLLDQLAALRWVQENIASFGGDPACVSVFGFSAGAISLGTLFGMPQRAGLFRRAITQSGSGYLAVPREVSASIARQFLLDMTLEPSSAVRLADLPADQLAAATSAFFAANSPFTGPARFRFPPGPGHARWILPFAPVIDGDVLARDPVEAVRTGAAADVDLMTGSTLHEFNLFLASDMATMMMGEDEVVPALAARLTGDETLARRLVDDYRRAGRVDPSLPPWAALAAVESDRSFSIPSVLTADAQTEHNSTTYAYRWERPASVPAMGATHGTDAMYVLGILDDPSAAMFVDDVDSAPAFSRSIQDAWIGFCRDGNPSVGDDFDGWKAYGFERVTMVLGGAGGVQADPYADVRPLWEGLL